MSSLAHAITGDANARVLVPHIDDVGMCHGANVAFLELARSGNVTCGSVMVPCPWYREIAAAAAEDPSLDLGVHLTLTSEWPQYAHPRRPEFLLTLPHVHGTSGFFIARLLVPSGAKS